MRNRICSLLPPITFIVLTSYCWILVFVATKQNKKKEIEEEDDDK